MKLVTAVVLFISLLAACSTEKAASPGEQYVGTWQCTGAEGSEIFLEIRPHETQFMLIDSGPNIDSSTKADLEPDGKLFFKMGGVSYNMNADGTLQCSGLGCTCGKDPYKRVK
jgi:hypothetical protein